MKQFVKLNGHIIRISLIGKVSYGYNGPCLYIEFEFTDKDKLIIEYSSLREYRTDKALLESILLEEGQSHETDKPSDYGNVLDFCHSVWNYYKAKKGDIMSSIEIRKALSNIDLDYCGYGVPKIYSEIAVKYGILTKVTPQRYKLMV